MDLIIIGTGNRGMIYGTWAKEHGHTVRAVAELRPDRLRHAGEALGVPETMRFSDGDDLLKQEKLADVAVIATMDRDHYHHLMLALDCGYDILLEKPISPDPAQCLEIEEKAKALGRTIIVCHVLRYTAFFSTLKRIIDSG